MAFRQSKYSVLQNQSIRGAILDVLNKSETALTISNICVRDMSLTNQTVQKMARELNNLIDMGLVRKTMSKSKKRMVYMAVSQLLDSGCNIFKFEVM